MAEEDTPQSSAPEKRKDFQTRKEIDETLNRRIWHQLRDMRMQRGVTVAFAAKKLGITQRHLYRIEDKGHSSLALIAVYVWKVLRVRGHLQLPEMRLVLEARDV